MAQVDQIVIYKTQISTLCAPGMGKTNSCLESIECILGGSDTYIFIYPYQVSLRILGRHYCGGSIISERHILTAAHCINEYTQPPFNYVSVVTGTTYLDKPGNVHRISKIDVHPGWKVDKIIEDLPYPHDLAVITLKEKIVFNDCQQKIALPSHNFEDDDEVTVTGWGITAQDPEVNPKQLQMLTTKLMARDKCQKKMSNPEKIKISDSQVCAFRSDNKSPCFGDSGSPLATEEELIGVFSWIDGDHCALGIPDIYTNVYEHKGYIQNILNNSNVLENHGYKPTVSHTLHES
ncbi:chymotrypsin-1-like [Phymastichus coffea]|uniref:chymotrypsin-1-like n=1 Tax=Phymastichus coffea TaxID=108790 RepID=UPI00273B3A9F|nr:chymotrypsin-1-like [Phymastichus coffea]